MIKPEIRVMGFDDAPFDKFHDKEALVIGAYFRGGRWLDGVVSTRISIDGNNATDILISLLQKTKFRNDLHAVFFKGIAVCGLNVLDIERLFLETHIPVLCVMRKLPDPKEMAYALKRAGMEHKIELIKRAGDPEKVTVDKQNNEHVYVQYKGLDYHHVKELIEKTVYHGNIAEPLRVAHLIAQGIVMGESKGRA